MAPTPVIFFGAPLSHHQHSVAVPRIRSDHHNANKRHQTASCTCPAPSARVVTLKGALIAGCHAHALRQIGGSLPSNPPPPQSQSKTPNMSSSHPKPTRSRLSSPHRHPSSTTGQNRGGNVDGSRSFMQRWLEPPVQNKASFQEAGLMRGGVVENMAPLGTLPKVAMLKKAPVSTESPPPTSGSGVKRIVLKKPFSSATVPLTTTPSATATPSDITRMSSSEAAGALDDSILDPLSPTSHLALPLPVVDDMNDDDYVPKKSKARRISHRPSHASASSASDTPTHPRRQSHRHKSARSSPAPPIMDPTPDPTPAPTAPASPTSPTHSETPSVQHLTREPDDKEQASKIVEVAVDEALRHFRYPTAWALRLLYDENSKDPNFVSMIEDMFYQRASPKTIRKFRRMVSEKKKEGKKENKGWYYFVPPPTNGHFTPQKPAPAPYENLIKMEFATLLETSARDAEVDADGHVNKKRKTEVAEARSAPINEANTPFDATVTADTTITTKAATNGVVLRPHGQRTGNHGNHSHGDHVRGGIAKGKSPRGKKTRSGSVSSTSSLSSVPDDVIEDYDDFMGSVDGDLGSRMEDELDEGNNAQIPAGSMQPISVGQAKPAVKKQIVSPNPAPEQNTPTTHHPRSRDSSMPAAAITITSTTNGNSDQHHAGQPIPTLKFSSRFGEFDESPDSFIRKKLSRKSETAVNTKSSSADSFVREPLGLDELLHEPTLPPQPPAPPPEHARLSRTPAPALTSRAARAAKRNHDEFDDASSPTLSSFRVDFEPLSSARNSRAATPTNPRSSKKPRGGLRVKTSPMKKKGTSAGIPRGNGERPSPVSNGIPNNQDDNDDSCYTCGGNGELVCCDGCTFSFHFMCIDPPMDEGRVPDEWYCNECQMRYNAPPEIEHKGAFGPLLTSLQRKNPRSFRLPETIREYFEGVKTGTEGEYEEAVPPKPKATKKNTEESFDFFKVRNGDKAVLCHQCHKGAADNRPIIPCSICGLNWHLECLSPPLALPPILRTWRCPCHVDDLLSDLPVRLAPAHKYRKIRNMPVIEQSYTRGLANNGWIEIEEDDSEDDDETAWRENKAFGRVFRVSARGIKEDFISRVHQSRGGSSFQLGTIDNPASTVPVKLPSLEEQQAALILVQLADGPADKDDQLAHVTMCQTNRAIASMAARNGAQHVDMDSLADADIATLETMLAQANALKQKVSKILESRTNHARHDTSGVELKALTPNSISHDASTIVDELKLEIDSSQETESAQPSDDVKPDLDFAMQTD